MKTYTAKAGDRLDLIFASNYSNEYKERYAEFLYSNIEFIGVDVFEGGELINLPNFETPTNPNTGIWS
ncbi:hypothetical protein [Helicobacter sp. 11S02629-2]|uniref:hypothetical protein n=1 Tax=Helicobacter sp. 11S02629-2 TaxID=1476195 RepID=UPI000BA4F7F0|nr:hypothetical protein [Helicobacter sp. 11S02629-2]PAF44162.1 hypothetical protein BKH40_06085 [Helicobacter sp. 11S02629-2]